MPTRFPRRAAAFAALVASLCASSLLLTFACAPATAQTTTALQGGVNILGITAASTASEADKVITQAAALHAKLVRVEAPWFEFEPNGPGQIDPQTLAFADRLIDDAAAAGIKVILIAEGVPCWASSAPAKLISQCKPLHESKANSWPPKDPSTFAEYTAFLATRYGTKLAAIEIWNEPDQANEDYFAGPEKPKRYAAVLRAAYTAIKAANPAVEVLGGSLVGSNGVFLKQLYAAGIKGFYDGLAVHFYNLTLASVRAIHETQLHNGDTTPLWLDEFGWSSCFPLERIEQEQGCVTEAVQAKNLISTIRELSRASYVAAAVVYKLQDGPHERFGLVGLGGRHKQSFKALQSALTAPFGPVSGVTLSLSRRHGQLVAHGSAPVGDYMRLEESVSGVLRYKVLYVLNRFNEYSLKLPRQLGTHNVKVRVFQYWLGRSHAATRLG
ncbi:MAG TPA: cellulase family glycosylhydrolase [Solirubrobacteraceae bacterium]|jgi:hypothetical protein